MKYSDGFYESFEGGLLAEPDNFESSANGALKLTRRIMEMFNEGFGWCIGDMARDELGNRVDPDDERACQWCLSGAIARATGVEHDTLIEALEWCNDNNEIPEDFVTALDHSLLTVSKGNNRVWSDPYPECNHWDKYNGVEQFNDTRTFYEIDTLMKLMEQTLVALIENRRQEAMLPMTK